MKKILYIILTSFFLLTFNQVQSACTCTFDRTQYDPLETITCGCVCTLGNEKSVSYNLLWNYTNGSSVEIDTGTTPATANEYFYETYIIPSGWNTSQLIIANLTGTDLEGSDQANISSASSNDLIISSISVKGLYIGKSSSVIATLKDENAKKVTGGMCEVYIHDNTDTQILVDKKTTPIDGHLGIEWVMSNDQFDEGIDYNAKIYCYCGAGGSETECQDEDGTSVNNSVGLTSAPFTTNTWLEVNTVTDKSLYIMKEEIFICANITNVNQSSRIPLHIYHKVRCSKEEDVSSDRDRALIISDSEPDIRGINTNTTQMQCKRFMIPEPKYLQGRNSQCYASTDVYVLDEEYERVMSYSTTSPVFNISSDELNLEADWERTSDYEFNAIVNLSEDKYSDYNGSGTGNIDVRLGKINPDTLRHSEQYSEGIIDFTEIIQTKYIDNITVTNSTDDEVTSALEFLEDGLLEIEIRDVDISPSGWYNVTLELNRFEENQTESLAGIESKTGTFRLSVNCPEQVYVGDVMTCNITSQIEDDQLIQKEVDFNCYIDTSTQSLVNWNQMVNRTSTTVSRNFVVPSTFTHASIHTLQCEANYYNLGSRQDTFSDSFEAKVGRPSTGFLGTETTTTTTIKEPLIEIRLPEFPEITFPKIDMSQIKLIVCIILISILIIITLYRIIRYRQLNY